MPTFTPHTLPQQHNVDSVPRVIYTQPVEPEPTFLCCSIKGAVLFVIVAEILLVLIHLIFAGSGLLLSLYNFGIYFLFIGITAGAIYYLIQARNNDQYQSPLLFLWWKPIELLLKLGLVMWNGLTLRTRINEETTYTFTTNELHYDEITGGRTTDYYVIHDSVNTKYLTFFILELVLFLISVCLECLFLSIVYQFYRWTKLMRVGSHNDPYRTQYHIPIGTISRLPESEGVKRYNNNGYEDGY